MQPTTFHNTIQLQGDDLKQAVAKATKQEEAILLIYKNTRKKFTASQITNLLNKAGHNFPIWSNRRGITNLKNKGELIMLSEKVMGSMGRPETYYQLNFIKYPTKQGEQAELFG